MQYYGLCAFKMNPNFKGNKWKIDEESTYYISWWHSL